MKLLISLAAVAMIASPVVAKDITCRNAKGQICNATERAAKEATAKATAATKNATKASEKAVAASTTAPAGATAKCKDGSFSTSKTHGGSCSHHGGVAAFLK